MWPSARTAPASSPAVTTIACTLWNAKSGKPIAWQLHGIPWVWRAVHCVAFSPDGTRIVSCGLDTVRLWDAKAESLSPVGTPLQHKDWVASAAFSPDGTRIVSGRGRHDAAALGCQKRRAYRRAAQGP